MRRKSDLHPYQERAIDHLMANPFAALFMECGLGKTATTLYALYKLIGICETKKILIVAPLRVAQTVWQEESRKWERLTELTFSKILGTEKQRLKALQTPADIYLINAENLVWLTQHLGSRRWDFDTVVFDEFSLFKNANSKRFKAAKAFRKKVKRVIGLTGTPAPNGIHDLWSQIYLLDQGQRLFKTLTAYRSKYFDVDYFGYTYTPKAGSAEAVQERIKDLCISMQAKDYLELPVVVENEIWVALPPKAQKAYEKIRKDLSLELDKATVDVANAAVLVGKSLQISNGALYIDDRQNYEILHDAKLQALEDIVGESAGDPILVFYQYKSDLTEIKKRLPHAVEISEDAISSWDKGEIPVMLAHPASAGHGINLQKGGHILVWYGLNYNLEQFEQANARLNRQGQTKPVIIHYLMAARTLDAVVLECLRGKQKTQRALIDAVKLEVKKCLAS